MGTEKIVITQCSRSNNYEETSPNLYLAMLNVSFPFQHPPCFGNNLLQITGKHQRGNFTRAELGQSAGCEELLDDVCAWRWQRCSVSLSVLGCAPVPPQNRNFRSLREWFCISSILVWLTSSSSSPQSFHSKFPFLAADLSLTKPLCCKTHFPQLHFLAILLLFYICSFQC